MCKLKGFFRKILCRAHRPTDDPGPLQDQPSQFLIAELEFSEKVAELLPKPQFDSCPPAPMRPHPKSRKSALETLHSTSAHYTGTLTDVFSGTNLAATLAPTSEIVSRPPFESAGTDPVLHPIRMDFKLEDTSINTHGDVASNNVLVSARNIIINYEHSRASMHLDKLPYSKYAPFDCVDRPDMRGYCHQETRVQFLMQLMSWVESPSPSKLAWLTGMAGTGKTTIAYSFAKRLRDAGRLGGSFFCSRQHDDCTKVKNILPTVAIALARAHLSYGSALATILKTDPNAGLHDVAEQFKNLFVDPFSSLPTSQITSKPSYAIIIDGLDECDDRESIEALITACAQADAANVPVLFLFSSVSDQTIRRSFRKIKNGYKKFPLDDVRKELVSADIERYLRDSMMDMMEGRSWIGELKEWPPLDQLSTLVTRSARLFLYAVLVKRYVERGHSIRQRLDDFTSDDFKPLDSGLDTEPIDALYRGFLDRALSDCTFDERSNVIRILSALACLKDSISMCGLSKLYGGIEIAHILSALHSVVIVPGRLEDPVSIFHSSFSDFLHTKQRSRSHYIDPISSHLALAEQCIRYLMVNLHQNMCNLPSNTMSNAEIQPAIIAEFITEELKYSCIHFPYHFLLGLGPSKEEDNATTYIYNLLWSFLDDHTAQWVECLSILGQVPIALDFVQTMKARYKDDERRDALSRFGHFLEEKMEELCRCPMAAYASDDEDD